MKRSEPFAIPEQAIVYLFSALIERDVCEVCNGYGFNSVLDSSGEVNFNRCGCGNQAKDVIIKSLKVFCQSFERLIHNSKLEPESDYQEAIRQLARYCLPEGFEIYKIGIDNSVFDVEVLYSGQSVSYIGTHLFDAIVKVIRESEKLAETSGIPEV